MRYVSRLFALVLAVLAAPFVVLARVAETFFLPKLDHRDSLALDRAAHAVDTVQPMRVRARAYVECLLNHDLYVADRFGLSRMPT